MSTPPLYASAEAAERITRAYDALLNDWPVPHRQRRIATAQGETFVIECGTADGPPLILLHGALGNSLAWLPDVPVWARQFRIFAVDVIGEPGFSAPSRPPLASEAYACWLEQVMDALGVPRASLVGISLGGWLALDFAIRRPDRLDRLVLICPGGIGPQRNVLYWALPLSLLGAWGRRKVRERILGTPTSQPTRTERRHIELWELISRNFRPRYDTLPIFTDSQLAALGMPVMAVVAGRDVMLAAGPMKRRLEDHVPNLAMHHLPQARHYPGSQAQPVLEFLTRA